MDVLGGWFPKRGVPQNGWFIIENAIKMDDLGDFLFSGCILLIVYGESHPLIPEETR